MRKAGEDSSRVLHNSRRARKARDSHTEQAQLFGPGIQFIANDDVG